MRAGGESVFTCILLHAIIGAMCPVSGLRDVSLTLPVAALRGTRVKLFCDYDLEDAQLYSLKWYLGDQEFFRFVPSDDPPTRIFPQQGINVDVSLSGARGVVLRDVLPAISGMYKCEVSADAPLFHTIIKKASMVVVDPPDDFPVVRVEDDRFQFVAGETLRANCTSPPSFPAANLTWFIDGRQVQDSYVRRYPTLFAASDIVGKFFKEKENEVNVRLDMGEGKRSERVQLKSFVPTLVGRTKEASTLGLEVRLDNSTVTFPVNNSNHHSRGVTPHPRSPIRREIEAGGPGRLPAIAAPAVGAHLRLRCLATLFTLYRRTTEVELVVFLSTEENAPKIAPVLHEEAQLGNESSGCQRSRTSNILSAAMANCLLLYFRLVRSNFSPSNNFVHALPIAFRSVD